MSTEDRNLQSGTTPLTPPSADAGATTGSAADGGQDVRRASGARAIVIVTAVIGGVALLGTGGSAAFAAASDLSRTDSEQSLDVDGIEGIDLDASASDVTVQFDDVEEAELTVTGGRGNWTMERNEDDLIVRSPDTGFGWWFGGNWFSGPETVVLTLPESLRATKLDAEFTLSAGSLEAVGDFGDLDVEVGAGFFSIEGSAHVLDIDMSAGRASIELDGVTEADLAVSAGDLMVELTGTAPDTVTIDVSAGSVNLALPNVDYNIVQDVSAGTLDSRVEESSSSRRTIDVSLSAGSVTLRPED
ncbi:DUF4097 family beta strand repeat-containing protein [Microbacterium sp. LWH12-1.2]|uniref:DUF4097 family beta strand repeat-containing protein n=1 Tax=Microbacterium sp. LWH12-1.2 TaxID=3135259 RepID=UPI003421E7A3